jgi:hypothetical protein
MSNRYEQAVKEGRWVENSSARLSNDCSRYAVEGENSPWVCHDFREEIDDPVQHDCWPVLLST